MSDGRYSMEWLESRLDLFDSEKSGLAVELHNRKHKSGLLSYILCGCAVLSLIFAALMAIAPNLLTGGLYRAGADVEAFLTILGILAVALCAAAVLFSSGTLRLGAIAVSALTLICGIIALLTMQNRLSPIGLSDEYGVDSINRFRSGSFVLENDIELGSEGVSIGSFSGRLDGAGRSIGGGRGLVIRKNYGSISDIAIDGVSVSGDKCALLCETNYGSISGVTAAAAQVNCEEGALVLNNRGSVKACSVAADYSCAQGCGGIALENSGAIDRCEFVGSFSGPGAFGGIALKQSGGSVSNCISRCAVSNAKEGSCGIVYSISGGKIDKCFTDVTLEEEAEVFYPVCGSAVTNGKGTVTRCYAIADDAYEICGDCSLIPADELCEARLNGLDFDSVWYFDKDGVLQLAIRSEGAAPGRTEEPEPTATPTPTPTPKPTATPVPATPEPTLSPEEMFGELDYYPEESELFEEPVTGSVKQGHNANVRPGPGGGYRSFMRLNGGEKFEIYAKSGNWYLICYNEVFGWVHQDMIKITEG